MNREELLRSARNLYKNPGTNEALKVVLEETYPELKESEDEKIRKALVDYFMSRLEISGENREWANGITYEEIVSYFEKQKNQKPAVEQLDGTFNSYDMAKTFVEGQYYVMEHPERFGLCKPAEWSDEDEKKLNHILEIVHIASGSEASVDEKEELESFLKSLRPSRKPSEEQMRILAKVVDGQMLNKMEQMSMETLYDDLHKLL